MRGVTFKVESPGLKSKQNVARGSAAMHNWHELPQEIPQSHNLPQRVTPAQQEINLDWPHPPFLLVPKCHCYLLNLRPKNDRFTAISIVLFSTLNVSIPCPWNALLVSHKVCTLCTYSQINSIIHSPLPHWSELLGFVFYFFVILFKCLSARGTCTIILIGEKI